MDQPVGGFPYGEVDSFAVPHHFYQCSFPFEDDQGVPNSLVLSSTFCPNLETKTSKIEVDESLFCSVNNPKTNFLSGSQQCSYSCNPSDSVSAHISPTYYFTGLNQIPENIDAFMSMGIGMGVARFNEKNTTNPYVNTMCSDIGEEVTACVNEGMSDDQCRNFIMADDLALAKEMLLKRKFDMPELQRGRITMADPSENAKKRIRVSRDAGSDGQSSCSYSSEDDNAASESKEYLTVNSNGKTRATRRGAIDPQSLYAKKRRERINERLRILQKLVPNGTKVDLSTMLEEAVHYVKFLQLQIKLLRSDELWMYAPLAYNGVDIGLHHNIFSQFLGQ